MGCDQALCDLLGIPKNFNPRTPGGVRRRRYNRFANYALFQSTHPGWGATFAGSNITDCQFHISIHAPRVGCDDDLLYHIARYLYFNPRTPGGVRLSDIPSISTLILYFNPRTPGGVRRVAADAKEITKIFQSTHPGWGATTIFTDTILNLKNFNPRTPGGVRRQKCIKDEMAFMFFCAYFSICM